MNKKRISAAALALAMTASVGASALATETAQPISDVSGDRVVNDGVVTEIPEQGTIVITSDGSAMDSGFAVDGELDAGFGVEAEVISEFYNGVVSINGEEIDSVDFTYSKVGDWQEYHRVKTVGELPGAPAGYIPMRLFCQAAGGTATFYDTEGFSSFYVNDTLIYTNYKTGEVSVMDDDFEMVVQENVSFYFDNGVTYLPISFIETLPRVSVYSYTFDGQEIFDIEIEPEGTAMDQLALEILDAAGMPSGDSNAADWFSAVTETEYTTYFEEVAGMFPMMNVQSDVLLIGKYAEGVDKEAAQECLKKLQAFQLNSFEHYLPEQYEKAKNAQIVESADGSYVMIVIASNTEAAIAAFQDGVIGLDQANNGIMPR